MGTAIHIHPPGDEGLFIEAICLDGSPAFWLVIQGDRTAEYVAEITIHVNNRELAVALAEAINDVVAEIKDKQAEQETVDD